MPRRNGSKKRYSRQRRKRIAKQETKRKNGKERQ